MITLKQDRDMFYSDYNYGGYINQMAPNPNMYSANTNMFQTPNMFNASGNMMSSGANILPNLNSNVYNEYENRISKLETEVKSNTDVEVNSNMYMI